MSNQSVNLQAKLGTFSEHWHPRIVAEFNGNEVMVAKVKGEFNWHSHPDTDDFFMVLEGEVRIEMRDRHVTVRKGELFVVPAGIEHRPIAEEEAHLLIVERCGTPNTGDEATAVDKEKI